MKERRSFSITGGMCPHCEGRGTVTDLDLSQLYDDSKSLREGALTVPGYTGGGWNSRLYTESGFYDPDKPIGKFTAKERHDFLHHEPVRMKIAGINQTYEGLIPRIQKSMLSKDRTGCSRTSGVRGPGRHVHHVPRVRRHQAQRGGPVIENQEDQHR